MNLKTSDDSPHFSKDYTLSNSAKNPSKYHRDENRSQGYFVVMTSDKYANPDVFLCQIDDGTLEMAAKKK